MEIQQARTCIGIALTGFVDKPRILLWIRDLHSQTRSGVIVLQLL
jgi:hypothetical protein